jgi:hypothetical protein
MGTVYIATYEDRAKVEAAMVAGDEDSAHDVAQRLDCQVSERFPSLDAAVAWANERVTSQATFYGLVTVDECRPVQKSDRCRYCTCGGLQLIRYHNVSGDGIDDTCSADETCLD